MQALARDLLAEAMVRVDAAGHKVILTVHDECVVEDPATFSIFADYMKLMKVVPTWAKGCPIDAEGYESARYRK